MINGYLGLPPLYHHMMDGWDVTPCPGLFPLTAEGLFVACYFSPSTYSDPAQEPVSPSVNHFRCWPKTIYSHWHILARLLRHRIMSLANQFNHRLVVTAGIFGSTRPTREADDGQKTLRLLDEETYCIFNMWYLETVGGKSHKKEVTIYLFISPQVSIENCIFLNSLPEKLVSGPC